MIQQFVARYIQGRGDPNGFKASYCKYVKFFWTGQNGRIGGSWAWDIVASAYPSNAANGGEMVRTEAEINQAKARVSGLPDTASLMLTANPKQAFKSGTAINDNDRMRPWVQSDPERVVKNLKDVILAIKYMATPTINTNYHNQGLRVATQFATAEQGLQRNYASTSTPYTIQGFDQLWLQFMRDYTNEVIGKFEAYLNLWSGSLVVWLPRQGETPTAAQQPLVDKINAVRAEVDRITAGQLFPNPF